MIFAFLSIGMYGEHIFTFSWNTHMLFKIMTEIIDFLLIMLLVGIVWMSFMYREAVSLKLSEYINYDDQHEVTSLESVSVTDSHFIVQWNILDTDTDTHEQRKTILADMDSDTVVVDEWLSMESHLSEKIKWYTFVFNDLPPWRRILIDSIDVDAPIVNVAYASQEKLDQWDFDSELQKWVVKYPYTAEPWEEGNWLLFGHSSVTTREAKENPFWYVFYHLPKLEHWDVFDVIRDGQAYSYKIDDKVIKKPEEVGEEIEKHDTPWSKSLTLMACYPLFSDLNRILLKWKLIEKENKNTLLWSNIFAQR